MNKFIFVTLAVFTLIFINSTSISAQACPPENACLCDPDAGYPACCAIEGPGGYNCGGGTSTPPPSGGGGAFQGQTCASGTTLMCGSPKIYHGGGGIPTCTFRATCSNNYFPAQFTPQEGTCPGTEGYCQDNCECCPANSTLVKTTTQGSNYQMVNSCHSPTNCANWDDVYVSHTTAPATVANRCYYACNNCGQGDEESWFWVYNVITTCRTVTTTWSCQSNCTASAPSAPTLVSPTSPANGSTVATTTNNLDWSTTGQTWGVGCPSNSNNYHVYLGTASNNMQLVGSFTQASGTSVLPITRAAGTYYWIVRATNGSLTTDSPTWSFTISDADPWWQVKDGDLTTNGDISSTVPTGQLFDTVGLGGFAGVPVYGNTFNLSSDTSKISTQRWNANTLTTQSRIFNYAFFENLIPSDINFNDVSSITSGGTPYTDGYEWYKATGDVSTSGDIDIGIRKVILFIENGNFNINGKINLTDGVGFFGVFVNGNIVISPTVSGAPAIEGVYLSDGSFSTGAGTSQLHVRGSVATFGTVNLQRDLTVDTSPAELFEFAPDQMLLFPEKLMFKRTKWTEVAP